MGIVKDQLYRLSSGKAVRFVKKQSIFPYYHIVRDELVPHIEHLYPYKNVAQFVQDLDVLCGNYSKMDVGALLNGKKQDNAFLLTFDDGLHEVYSVIYPILKERNIPAIFFINPNFIDNNEGMYKHYIGIILKDIERKNYPREILDAIAQLFAFEYNSVPDFIEKFINIPYTEQGKVDVILERIGLDIKTYLKSHMPYITRAQIQEMIDNGYYFGGHTMSHPPLVRLSHEEQKTEIIHSIQWLKDNFGIKYSMFAFPFSDGGISKKLINELFVYDESALIFGNAGIKKDISERIIQRFSLENPMKDTKKQIVTENMYKFFNKAIGKYRIRRK